MKDRQGRIIHGEEEQNNTHCRWKEHFEELLNRPTPVDRPDIHPAEEYLSTKCFNVLNVISIQKNELKKQ